MEDDEKPRLPMDIIFKIPAHITDPATLVRAASSHKLWHNLIKDSTFLDGLKKRHSDHGFTSSLLLGFFYQESSEAASHLWQHHEDKNRCLAPSFISTSEFIPFHGSKEGCNAVNPLSLATFLGGIGASLNFYKPVASQDSFLVLCHRSQDEEGHDMPDLLCVCNPVSGEVFQIPNRRDASPQYYVLLVTDDVGLDGRMSQSFQLVAIWIKGKKFIYNYYCSNTRAWWRPTNVPELMPGHYLISSPAAASHGGDIHWLCGSWKSMAPTHVCTLTMGQQELSYVDLPPEAKSNKVPLLTSSADGGILLLLAKGLQMSLWKHKNESGNDSSNWVLSETIDLTTSLAMRLQMIPHMAKFRLEIFRGKSGAVVLWIEEEGLYLFCLSDRSMRKIDNENVTKKYFFCPYEIDWLSCLAVTNLVVDGSLDGGRKKIHCRWKTLMAESVSNNAMP
ncbi:hypothetical protein QOZ80_4AG0323620 [Eleusine coracana subsp. coracana]|nr:hypothetical protein QOZ80_4AG0323620 [Eleusine coracana subsp. coracana]